MTDYSNMTNEELLAIAGMDQPGATPAPQPDMSQMSNEELMRIAGGQSPQQETQPSGFFQSIPGKLVAGTIENLPTAGMIIGGALPAAGGPLGMAASPVASGLGAGIGQAARGYLQEKLGLRPPQSPVQNITEIGKQGLMGAAVDAAAPIIAGAGPAFGGIQKLTSPYAESTAARIAGDEGVAAAQKLVESGVPILPSVINPTKGSRFFQYLAENMWPASSVVNKSRQSLQGVADQLQQDFVASRGLYETSKGGANAAWENWVTKAGGKEAPYEMPQTAKVIEDALNKPFGKMGTFWKKDATTFKDTLEGTGQVTVQEIRDLLSTLKPTAVKGADRTARMKVADAIMEDLGASGNAEMVDALANARELARLQRIAGPLQSIFNKATIPATKVGEEETFNPASFVNLWNQRRGYFLDNPNYSAGDIRTIDAFASKMKAIMPDLQKASEFTSPLSIQGATQFNLKNPAAVVYGTIKYPALAIPAGADAGLAFSLMNPNGLLRKYLTTGFGPPTLSTKATMMGIMEKANE